MGILESKFQARVIQTLRDLFPGAVILKNDPNYLQGFPDLTILYTDTWAVLETKRFPDSPYRPNQEYYIEELRKMGGYANTIQQENEDEVYHDLQQALRFARGTRLPITQQVSLGELRRRKNR